MRSYRVTSKRKSDRRHAEVHAVVARESGSECAFYLTIQENEIPTSKSAAGTHDGSILVPKLPLVI